MTLNIYTHKHTQACTQTHTVAHWHNACAKLWMCFHVLLFEGKKYICCSPISQRSLTPSVNPSPAFSLLCLWSTSHAISPARYTHLERAHTDTETASTNEAYCCMLWERKRRVADMWGCISELRRIRRFFLLLICFPPPVKSCRTHSSTQCSVWVTALVSFWDLELNYSCLQRDELPKTLKLTIVSEKLLSRT